MPLLPRSVRERHTLRRRGTHFLERIVEAARTTLAPLLAGRSQRCEFAPSTPGVEAMADAAKDPAGHQRDVSLPPLVAW